MVDQPGEPERRYEGQAAWSKEEAKELAALTVWQDETMRQRIEALPRPNHHKRGKAFLADKGRISKFDCNAAAGT